MFGDLRWRFKALALFIGLRIAFVWSQPTGGQGAWQAASPSIHSTLEPTNVDNTAGPSDPMIHVAHPQHYQPSPSDEVPGQWSHRQHLQPAARPDSPTISSLLDFDFGPYLSKWFEDEADKPNTVGSSEPSHQAVEQRQRVTSIPTHEQFGSSLAPHTARIESYHPFDYQHVDHFAHLPTLRQQMHSYFGQAGQPGMGFEQSGSSNSGNLLSHLSSHAQDDFPLSRGLMSSGSTSEDHASHSSADTANRFKRFRVSRSPWKGVRARSPNKVWTKEELDKYVNNYVRPRFAEPEALKRLPWSVPPSRTAGEDRLTKTRDRLHYVSTDHEIREMINNEIFGGRLKWVAEQLPMEKNPRQSIIGSSAVPSRVLPFIKVPGFYGVNSEPLDVRMVILDSFSPRDGRNNGIARRARYTFWAFPNKRAEKGFSTFVKHHGVGHLEEADFDHVNSFLLEKMNSVSKKAIGDAVHVHP
ncbi:hypothetical protein NDA10_004439 [Ustilago hordei]|nr:hypothetical protein NDA10_004439 [Ustilago hordei]UTT91362.1 hypothetical protein NDA17_004172 [Ustilago hordei]